MLMVFVTALTVCADTFDLKLSTLGWTDRSAHTEIPATGTPLKITADKASSSTAPTYYTADGLRVYKNGLINFSVDEGYAIKEIVITGTTAAYTVSGSAVDKDGKDIGTLTTSSTTATWKGEADYVQIKNTGVSKHARITDISVTYEYVLQSAVEPVEISYTLDKADGIVTLTTATDGATIYYGFSEDEMTNEYTKPFTVKESGNVYAYAAKGEDKSITKFLYIDLPFTSFRDALNNTKYEENIAVVGDFEVIYVNEKENRLILTDGVSNILVFSQAENLATDYAVGTKISKVEGERSRLSNCMRLIDATLTKGGNGATYSPKELTTFADLTYEGNIFDEVVIKNANISGKEQGAPVIELGEETIPVHDIFKVDFENTTGCDITGFVWRLNNDMVIVPVRVDGGTVTETVDTPVITPNKRELQLNDEVTIKCDTEGAVIYYTLDGTEPTEESEKYTAPIPFKESCTIKAKAFYGGNDKTMFPSVTASREYHVIDPTVNVISEGNHDADLKNTLNSYVKHSCTVDGVEYHMNAAHLGENGNGNAGSASSIMMNDNGKRFCYLIQVGDNEGYVLDKIELAYNTDAKATFTVRAANTPFDDSAEAWADYKKAITSHGTIIGTMSKDAPEIAFAKDYKYFAIYPSADGAVYLDNITIRYRQPAPLATPELKGLDDYEDVSVNYDEEENIYTVKASEELELYFEDEDLDNPDVQIMYMIMGGSAAGDDDNMGLGEPSVYDAEKGFTISESCALIYFAVNTATEETSEAKTYMFVIEIPEVEAPAVPVLKGVEALTDMSEEDEDMKTYYGTEAVTLSFDKQEGIEIYYLLDEFNFGVLSVSNVAADDDEEPTPTLYTEPIVLKKSGMFGLKYWAVDTKTQLASEEVSCMIMLQIEEDPVEPEELEAPELTGANIVGNVISSEQEMKVNFKAADGIHIYYSIEAKEAPAKVVAYAACEDEHAGFVKHDGNEITLNATHKSFSFFACDPATGRHSKTVTYTLDVATGIDAIDAEDADAIYFDFNGVQIAEPAKGMYIRVVNGKAEKIVK